jgi:hypothetical protein
MTKYLLEDREKNYADDSDFYAIFWDSEAKAIRSEEYGSTRFPSPTVAPASYLRDIPADVQAEINTWYAARLFEILKLENRKSVDEPCDAKRGDILVTTKAGAFKDKRSGTTVAYGAGEVGEVIWSGAFGQFYAKGYKKIDRSNLRVGLRFDDGRVVFIGLKDCKTNRQYASDEDLRETAERFAAQGHYVSLFAAAGMIVM